MIRGSSIRCSVDIVVDHSVISEFFGDRDAARKNLALEYEQNSERYTFLKWARQAFRNLRVIPPAKAFCIRSISNIWRSRSARMRTMAL